MQFPLVHARTAFHSLFPGFFGFKNTWPKGKRPALKRPGIIDFAPGIPENTVKIGFFLEGKAFGTVYGRYPAAMGPDKLIRGQITFLGERGNIIF
jgi:hypothetical protein